ncbi:hypothetical protein [Tissierella sp. Yu-01]|uniref:hypothetical protein n=1 Tax=Tissierella sp. Yu-01 TaxID=3035694 RepID=UPI00240D67F8|nr:hypothetical protein [Tissierella sp. Yu-01]WFA09586.1 hypothetical protein P3962_03260 [Tissierella sp. Yu-01]
MKTNGIIYYLNNKEDYIVRVNKNTRELLTYVYPVTEDQRGEIIERGFILVEGQYYLISENGVKNYCYLENEELIPF